MGARSKLVLLVRHGKAEDSHPLGDRGRALTGDGREAFREHARTIVDRAALTGIATSPLVRAVQTAEILADAFGLADVTVRRELDAEGASANSIAALARELGPGWALVGHNPSMAEALAHMIAHTGEAPRFRKGGIVALEPESSGGPGWRLRWIADPGRSLKRDLD